MSIEAHVQRFLDGLSDGPYEVDDLVGTLDLDQGQALQLAVLERLRAEGRQVAGWKLGMTSGRSRDAMGKGVRPFGFILADRVLAAGETVPRLARDAVPGLGIETEICFRLRSPLGGADVSAEDARRACGGLSPAFEINSFRLRGSPDAPLRVADNLSQWGIVVGIEHAPVPSAEALQDLEVACAVDGSTTATVAASGHIDDHFESLARLARELHRFGLRVEAGQRVITGAFTRGRVESPGRYEGRFGPYGKVVLDVA